MEKEKIEELRCAKPNLWRVACELSKCKEPYKVLDMLMALAVPMLRGRGHECGKTVD